MHTYPHLSEQSRMHSICASARHACQLLSQMELRMCVLASHSFRTIPSTLASPQSQKDWGTPVYHIPRNGPKDVQLPPTFSKTDWIIFCQFYMCRHNKSREIVTFCHTFYYEIVCNNVSYLCFVKFLSHFPSVLLQAFLLLFQLPELLWKPQVFLESMIRERDHTGVVWSKILIKISFQVMIKALVELWTRTLGITPSSFWNLNGFIRYLGWIHWKDPIWPQLRIT